MTRETRNNLIFIIILIVVTLPGAVMLFKKKLAPNARPIGAPEPVKNTTAYMDPFDVPDDFRRVVPQKVEAWVRSLIQAKLAAPTSQPMNSGRPVMSEARVFEVIDFSRNAAGVRLSVILWNMDGKPDLIKSRCGTGKGAVFEPLSHNLESLVVPADVLEEIRLAGFVTPPKNVHLLTLQFPDVPNPTMRVPVELMVQTFKEGNTPIVDFVRIFTSPANEK